jgi:hypothetical protein
LRIVCIPKQTAPAIIYFNSHRGIVLMALAIIEPASYSGRQQRERRGENLHRPGLTAVLTVPLPQ